jgi:hypothetical protein
VVASRGTHAPHVVRCMNHVLITRQHQHAGLIPATLAIRILVMTVRLRMTLTSIKLAVKDDAYRQGAW